MSNISRVDKYVIEKMGLNSLDEANEVRSVSVNIVLSPDVTGKVSIMAITALNLALRCFKGEIRIYSINKTIAPPPGVIEPLEQILKQEAERFGSSERIIFLDTLPEEGATLALGCHVDGGFCADSAGWVSYINKLAPEEVQNTLASVPAAVFAVACVFAKLFKEAVMHDFSHTREQWHISLLSLTASVSKYDYKNITGLNLGSVVLLGLGAIGSAVGFILALSDYSAEILAIDKDRYEEPNLETTMLISKEDAINIREKAPCMATILNKGNIKATYLVEQVDAASDILTNEFDIFICGVDNPETRRNIEGAAIRTILNGGIGGTREDAGHILVSRHSDDSDIKISELYSETSIFQHESANVPDEFASDECNRIDYLGVAMAAPFLGVATGALLVARCAHELFASNAGTNYFKMDLLSLQSRLEVR